MVFGIAEVLSRHEAWLLFLSFPVLKAGLPLAACDVRKDRLSAEPWKDAPVSRLVEAEQTQPGGLVEMRCLTPLPLPLSPPQEHTEQASPAEESPGFPTPLTLILGQPR